MSTSPSLARLQARHYLIIATDQLPADIAEQAKSANGKIKDVLGAVGIATATSDDPAFAAKAARIVGVRSVVRDFTYQGIDLDAERNAEAVSEADIVSETTQRNPLFRFQWGHTAIQAPQAWATGAQGAGVIVADLDSGFDLMHPDLQDNIIGSTSFVEGEPWVQPRPGGSVHGTHTAGTIAATDGKGGVVGVAPKASLLLVKVLGDRGSGSFSGIIQGIVYAADNNADVINMSLGATFPRNGRFLNDNNTPNDPSDDFIENEAKAVQEILIAINRATSYANKKGVTIIASAGNAANNGNQDQSMVHIPSDATGVISISATAPLGWAKAPETANLDRFASYSNYGTPAVSFAAPGGDGAYRPLAEMITFRGITTRVRTFDFVLSTITGGYAWLAGTSMAAPHVTGVAALIIGKNGGSMDPTRVEAVLRASADDLGKPGRDPYYGHGRVNALRAVQAN
jgi:subtilisin family serine protease